LRVKLLHKTAKRGKKQATKAKQATQGTEKDKEGGNGRRGNPLKRCGGVYPEANGEKFKTTIAVKKKKR